MFLPAQESVESVVYLPAALSSRESSMSCSCLAGLSGLQFGLISCADETTEVAPQCLCHA